MTNAWASAQGMLNRREARKKHEFLARPMPAQRNPTRHVSPVILQSPGPPDADKKIYTTTNLRIDNNLHRAKLTIATPATPWVAQRNARCN